MISFRLRAVVIQLLAQSLIAAFRRPSAQLINEVEDALSALTKDFAKTKVAGRKSLNDSFDKDGFVAKLRETYEKKHAKMNAGRPTQDQLAREMGLSKSALKYRLTHFHIDWPPA